MSATGTTTTSSFHSMLGVGSCLMGLDLTLDAVHGVSGGPAHARTRLPWIAMRALELVGFDGPASLQLADRPVADPAADEVRVGFKATALNHLDVFITRGLPK